MNNDELSSLHHSFYRDPSVTSFYDSKRDLQAPETTLFRHFESELKSCRFLDVGIGAGRTTEHVLAFTQDYVGVDYVPEMIETAKKRFPHVDLRVADARSMSDFGDASFDTILFSFNGLDTLTESDRLAVLKEVRRLLRPGGLFLFSTHNRSKKIAKPWERTEFTFSFQPLRLARHLLYYLQGLNNYRRTYKGQWEKPECAFWVDTGTNFSAPMYFITKTAQVHQLREAGFNPLIAVSQSGEISSFDAEDRRSSWIYFACRIL